MGFPIRKSPDQSLLSSSPRHIAASHVLHRLLAPRHSPFALTCLTKTVVTRARRLSAKSTVRVGSTRLLLSVLQKNERERPFSCGNTKQEPIQLSKTISPSSRPAGRSKPTDLNLGGADRDRTDDLRLAKPALSQLSYSPAVRVGGRQSRPARRHLPAAHRAPQAR